MDAFSFGIRCNRYLYVVPKEEKNGIERHQEVKIHIMDKKNLIWIAGLGALGLALFFAYKKRNVPTPSKKEGEEGIKQPSGKKKFPMSDMSFAGMDGKAIPKTYVKTTNLIPDVYGRYHNADGGSGLDTSDICAACKTAPKNTPQPTMLAGFR